ncbi:MAG: hypothetical protein QXM38_00020 [Candidatus Aenigmatarchaeota archaeon]
MNFIMIIKLVKIALFIGVLFSSLALLITKILPPTKEVIILLFYIIILSSVSCALVIYYEFYWKPKKQMRKLQEIMNEIKSLKNNIESKYKVYDDLIFKRYQTLFVLDESLKKIEKKMEKIEKIMGKSTR